MLRFFTVDQSLLNQEHSEFFSNVVLVEDYQQVKALMFNAIVYLAAYDMDKANELMTQYEILMGVKNAADIQNTELSETGK